MTLLFTDIGTTSIVFYDDARARDFEPFATSRPLCETRSGALLVRERWQHVLHAQAAGFVSSSWLHGFAEFDAPRAFAAADTVLPGQWLVNSRALPHLGLAEHVVRRHDVLSIGGRVAAVLVQDGMSLEGLHEGLLSLDELAAALPSEGHPIDGVWLDEVWDMLATLTPLLMDDIPRIARQLACNALAADTLPQVVITGTHPVWVEVGAIIEPFVAFDTHAGPILLRHGVHVQSFTRVAGPCYVAEHSTVTADKIANCSIGPMCRVHGEVSSSIFLGYANKGHDGFIGHSVIGRWVNLGAGTITSNLKNTYGAVTLWTPAGTRWTGQQFLGTLFGDHVKTGIGLRLTTGTVLGAGANVYDAMPPKRVRPFSWGNGRDPYTEFDVDKFIATAGRMMQRRNVQVDDATREHLRTLHARAMLDTRWEKE